MGTSAGKGRSAVVIVAFLAALGGVVAFSGKSTTVTSKSTTTAVANTATSARTAKFTTTAVTEANSTITTRLTAATNVPDAAARVPEPASKRPRALTTPILPEKTGTKMLLSFLIMLGTVQLGVLRRYADADAVDADVHDVLVPRSSVLQSVDSGGRRRRHV